MRKTESIKVLLVVAVVISALALISNASAPPSVAGVALLQFGCTADPGEGGAPVYGPVTEPVGSGGFCDAIFGSTGGYTGGTPVPAGNLYHLRVNLGGINTLDGSVPNVQITVYDGATATRMTCQPTALPAICQDFTHQFSAKSGDPISLSVTLVDSNTSLKWLSATVEETVFR